MDAPTIKILRGALDGDAAAKGELLERLRPRLILWVTARLSDELRAKTEPEDVVQEILLAVHRDFSTVADRTEKEFQRWLFTVAENRIRDLADHFGAIKRRPPDPLPFDEASPSTAAIKSELSHRLRKALARLSEPHRQVIQMRRFEERDVAEIAKIMDRSENAVRILYCRAIAELKKEMA